MGSGGDDQTFGEQPRLGIAYFHALEEGDGAAAASLFAEDGVLDDLIGAQHRGRTAIKDFISQRPPLTLDVPLNEIHVPGRSTYFGRIHFADGRDMNVRWIFTFRGDRVAHLCNSRVQVLVGVGDAG